ncbi:MAG: MBL fold metallo-hydrolase, partial [Spirochaetales bacterium]|nr:MBL fold metallo-hydrolase [Spirochaetales bacterium]
SLGSWQTNSYVITKDGENTCWIIDAGFEPDVMIKYIKDKALIPERLIYTHAHLDHIAGVNDIIKEFPDIKTAISPEEKSFLSDPVKNMSSMMGFEIKAPEADQFLSDGDILNFCGSDFVVFSTPGHSPGGICLYQKEENILFSGDTLFQGSVGRYDFPTSNGQDLFDSIKNKLMILPDSTNVYPGHGGKTTIGFERTNNMFL